MRAIILDDEKMAVELLSIMLKDYEDVELVGGFTRAQEALDSLDSLDPQIVFLDIEMGKVFGLDFASKLLEKKPGIEIVFVTAYSQYAVDAFELDASDYLLKPISKARLDKTLDRLRLSLGQDPQDKKSDGLAIRSFNNFELLDSSGQPLKWRTQKVRELFVYLWNQEGKAVNRVLILEDLFPDRSPDRAMSILHTTVYQLRKSLSQLDFDNPLVYSNESYQLNVEIDSDLDEFNELIDKDKKTQEEILRVLDLYKDGFLVYEDYSWAMVKEKKLQDRYYDFLRTCSEEKVDIKKFDLTLKRCLDQWYRLDPLNERLALLMMAYYEEIGSSGLVQDFYESFSKNCLEELGSLPSPLVQEAYESLFTD